jgi:hypothetical protein
MGYEITVDEKSNYSGLLSFCLCRNLDGRRTMRSKFYMQILLVVILIIGCATPRMYEGPKLPKDQVATVEGSITAYLGVWFLVNVGTLGLTLWVLPNSYITFNYRTGDWRSFFKYYRGNPPKIEVLLGYNEIYVNLYKEWFIDYCGEPLYHREYGVRLKFNAEAGQKYKVKAPFLWKKGSILRLVDVDSGEVVASERFR